jgi:hypothetical protein
MTDLDARFEFFVAPLMNALEVLGKRFDDKKDFLMAIEVLRAHTFIGEVWEHVFDFDALEKEFTDNTESLELKPHIILVKAFEWEMNGGDKFWTNIFEELRDIYCSANREG